MIELTRNQIAELRGCSPATVSRAKLRKTKGGNYDLNDPEVWDYVIAPSVEKEVREKIREMRKDRKDNSVEGLEAQKLEAEIEWKKKQSRKLDLQHEMEKKDLVPIELIGIWIGYFATGIKNNFLTLGKRIARGDLKLQERIDRFVSKSLEKTIDTAKKELQHYSDKLISDMDGEVDD